MGKKAFEKIKAGLEDVLIRLAPARNRRDERELEKSFGLPPGSATLSCGCVFCDIGCALFHDERGFYHDGAGERVACALED